MQLPHLPHTHPQQPFRNRERARPGARALIVCIELTVSVRIRYVMASVSQAYSHPESWEYNPNPKRRVRSPTPSLTGGVGNYKVSHLLSRIQIMASCSQQSRKVLVVLRRRVSSALEQEKMSPSTWHVSKDSSVDYTGRVSCRNCEGFMVQPVCLPCGHSLCKSCTEKSNIASNDSLTCPNCNQVCSKIPPKCVEDLAPGSPSTRDQKCRAPTLIIQNAFRRWYPDWVESCRYREEGNMYANKDDFTNAVHHYSQALEKGYFENQYNALVDGRN